MSKYRAVHCREQYPDCPTGHASLREHRRWVELTMLERAGYIAHLEQQKAFELAPSVKLFGRKKPPLRWVADFVYDERDDENWTGFRRVVEDCKGRQTEAFRIKAHLMAAVYGVEIRLT